MTPEEKALVEREMELSHRIAQAEIRENREFIKEMEAAWANPQIRAKMEAEIMKHLEAQNIQKTDILEK